MDTLAPAPAIAPAAAPAPAKAPALPNAPKVEIQVSKMGMPAEPAAPPKKGSARDAMLNNLRERAGKEPGTTETAKEEPPKQDLKKADPEPAASEDPTSEESPKPGEDKKTKVSPWKLVEEFKAKLARAEADKLDIEKRAIPEAKWKEKEAELDQKSKRLQELEDEIRFVNYSKSEEFKNTHQVPYEKAWSKAMEELGELTVEVDGGEARPMNASDLLDLVNLPLGKAHELAVEKFGDLAPEVMAHRKEIKNLFDKQSEALENARKSGAERERKAIEDRQKGMGELHTQIRETWSKANEEITADEKYGKFFTKIDGDDQVNQRLAKGFELADRAFSENPTAPGLTAEQRQSIVKRHAAVRNRAAAFGRLVYENGLKDAKISDMQKIIDEYKGSSPETRGSNPGQAKQSGPAKMSSVLEELRKRAK